MAALALAGLIGLLAVAALGGRYRLAAATGVAGCCGFAALDAALILSAIFVLAPVGWVTAVAMRPAWRASPSPPGYCAPPWGGNPRLGPEASLASTIGQRDLLIFRIWKAAFPEAAMHGDGSLE